MHIDITWKGESARLDWTGERVTLGGGPADTRPLAGAPTTLVELTRSGPHPLIRTAVPHSLGGLLFPAHVWRLWAPGEFVSVGEQLRLSLVEAPGDGLDSAHEGTSALARHLLGDEPETSLPGTASLRVLSGRDVGRRLMLGQSGQRVLGRGRGAALALMDETISRAHLGFSFRDGTWWVEDLGGPNGLFVDGRRWKQCALRAGAVLELGRVWLRFDAPAREPAPSSSAPPAAAGSGASEPSGPEVPPVTRSQPPAPAAAGWLRALVGLGGAAALIGAAWL